MAFAVNVGHAEEPFLTSTLLQGRLRNPDREGFLEC